MAKKTKTKVEIPTAIRGIIAREILDSRGRPTVEVDVITDLAAGRAIAPSGASVGTREALELRDSEKRFAGFGVRKAVANIEKIAKKIIGKDVTKQKEIDKTIVKLAGPQKKKIGANATTALSLAVCAAAAAARGIPVWQYLNPAATTLPIPMMNIINGGLHAGNQLAIQEFMVVPVKFKQFSEALCAACEIYYQLGKNLEAKYGRAARNVGDEGGYAPQMKYTKEALDAIVAAINELGYYDKVFIALDCAASTFFKEGAYVIDGKRLQPFELLAFYKELTDSYPILSIEDPFEENDLRGFARATNELKIQIVGDDIYVSNAKYLRKGIKMGAGNAILLKVNQVGTLTEAIQTARLAKENDWNVIVSHRSGETEDTFIADLAVALETGFIKCGAPARGERTAKYNQLLRIEEELGSRAKFGTGLGLGLLV